MGFTVIDYPNGLNFSELNSEVYMNMMNFAINDGVNLNETETDEFCSNDKSLIANYIPGVGINICHIDYI